MQQTENTIHSVLLDSHDESIRSLEPLVKEIALRYTISKDCFSNILVSLTEAVHNAIMHGNKYDTNKKVSIQVNQIEKGIRILVSDEGEGFDPNKLANPLAKENITSCGGRGVFIIKHLSDSCSFQNNGRTVNFQFKL